MASERSDTRTDRAPVESATIRDLDEVDWLALWQEVGCPLDEPMSETQLATALKVSDQDIGPGIPDLDGPGTDQTPEGLIVQWVVDEDGVDVPRGYLLSPEVKHGD